MGEQRSEAEWSCGIPRETVQLVGARLIGHAQAVAVRELRVDHIRLCVDDARRLLLLLRGQAVGSRVGDLRRPEYVPEVVDLEDRALTDPRIGRVPLVVVAQGLAFMDEVRGIRVTPLDPRL